MDYYNINSDYCSIKIKVVNANINTFKPIKPGS